MEHLGKYATGNARAIPAMTVTVTKAGKEVRTYRTPAGFRLDQYVADKNPEGIVSVSYPAAPRGKHEQRYRVVAKDEAGNEIETHTGVYDVAVEE
jgi:hypothetical protein